MLSAAIVVFVKTPGVSPLKTRLAKTIGQSAAHDFYQHSVNSIREVLSELKASSGVEVDYRPFWAVAEESELGSKNWSDFSCLSQGCGGLGERLYFVHKQLWAQHDVVVFLGADAPQISSDLLSSAIYKCKNEQSFVLGPSADGGYYLFASHLEVAREVWLNTPYSASDTAIEFTKLLEEYAPVVSIQELTDVDEGNELWQLKEYLMTMPKKNSSQKSLLSWIEQNNLIS